jgi:L-threonylcarbamoyladenylate synthase
MNEAVERLRAGKLVAFPTETVYGLGANALDADAVARIFAAKGRPSTNPIIVHVADIAQAKGLAADWPSVADQLAAAFWPGPLTLVLPKTNAVPDIVTAGGETIGLRVPKHPVALELLQRSGVPIAAPSANRSEEVSPTTAQHVADSLDPYVNDLLVLDGGPCQVGIESTVLDVTADPPRLLRPGMVTERMLRRALGEIVNFSDSDSIARSPGQMPRHYAPRSGIILVSKEELSRSHSGMPFICYSNDLPLIKRFNKKGHVGKVSIRAGLIGESAGEQSYHFYQLPDNPEGYAAGLYDALRTMDEYTGGFISILVEEPPAKPEWAAIHDRLRRAATPKETKG